MDALAPEHLGEELDFIYCCGILHRVKNPLALLRILRELLTTGGSILVETYGADNQDAAASLRATAPGEIYMHDNYVYWRFTKAALQRLAITAGFATAGPLTHVQIDGHPRIVGQLTR